MSDAENITKYLFNKAGTANLEKTVYYILTRGYAVVAETDGFPLCAEYIGDRNTIIEFRVGEEKTDFEYTRGELSDFLRDEYPEKWRQYEYGSIASEELAQYIAEHLEIIFKNYKKYFNDVPKIIKGYFFSDLVHTLRRR